jgi:hypothetical protein
MATWLTNIEFGKVPWASYESAEADAVRRPIDEEHLADEALALYRAPQPGIA